MRKDTDISLTTLKQQLHQKWYMDEWDTKESLTNTRTDFTYHLIWIILMIGLLYLINGL